MLSDDVYDRLDAALAGPDSMHATVYPGDDGSRQPVHTVYVPADRARADTPRSWGDEALAAMDDLLPDAEALAELLDIDADLAAGVYPRVRRKLTEEPIEDLRIDFEDGFVVTAKDDLERLAEEDAHSIRASGTLLNGGLPFCGIRIKSLEAQTRKRAVRTLDIVCGGFEPPKHVPANFVVTLPKVTTVEEVAAFVDVLAAVEEAHGIRSGMVRFEIQIETPQAVLGHDGTATVARMLDAGRGRVSGLHYGTYDYSAACGIAGAYQSLEHPVADYAKAVMQVAAADTGVRLSDGSSNVLPVGSPGEVRAAWRLHARLVTRSLERGFYQGWDLHPAQLVTRYAATYAFYRAAMPAAAARLRAYTKQSKSAVLDEPATAQALASLLVRGLQCGAVDEPDVTLQTGLERADLDALYHRTART